MDTRDVRKGENLAVPADAARLQLVVGWSDPHGDREVDASALLTDEQRQVRSDADFVFYNQPASPDGSVRHLGRISTDAGAEERIAIDLETVPEDVASIAVTASVDRGSFGDLDALRLVVRDGTGDLIARYDINDASVETAFVFGEIYRREGWRFRAVGQGWDTGLAGLATDYGVTVDEDGSTAADGEHATESELPTQFSTADGDELVDVVDAADETDHAESPAPDSDTAGLSDVPDQQETRPARASGVRTRRPKMSRVAAPPLTLAGHEGWQAARLFSISGVGVADEQEKRATSALLATMMGVRPFARGIAARLGAPAGTVETYLEVPFVLGERTVYPDGVVRIGRAGRIWTALLEVKTGSGQLRRDQVENYLDVARQNEFDAVVTLSNEISPRVGEHPVAANTRKFRKVAVLHLSWAEVLHEARMVLMHRGVADPLQAWLLTEFIRYLEHPRSGATGFEDMGAAWVAVREAVVAGTMRASDRKASPVADAWIRLVRQLCLRLTAELGVEVRHVLPRRVAADPVARTQAVVTRLAAAGVLDATLRVPGSPGPLTVTADLRTGQIRTSVELPAPQEHSPQRRIAWLLRQFKEGTPDDLLVEVHFSGRNETTCERLGDARTRPAALILERGADPTWFRLSHSSPMGTKRSGVRGAFVPTVMTAVETFYGSVAKGLESPLSTPKAAGYTRRSPSPSLANTA